MPSRNTLRNLIILQIALLIGQRIAASASIARLIGYYGLQFNYLDPVTSLFGRTVGSAVFLALLAAILISSIGLFRLSSSSRTAYLIVNIIAIVFGLLHGPIVRSGSMDFFYSANILLTGVILTMVFSSPFKSMYEGGSGAQPIMMPASPSAAISPAAPVPAPPGAVCMACGASTQGAKFCPLCGKPVVMKKTCSRCGAESIPGEKFCRECGNFTP